jgi:hypothetical protein
MGYAKYLSEKYFGAVGETHIYEIKHSTKSHAAEILNRAKRIAKDKYMDDVENTHRFDDDRHRNYGEIEVFAKPDMKEIDKKAAKKYPHITKFAKKFKIKGADIWNEKTTAGVAKKLKPAEYSMPPNESRIGRLLEGCSGVDERNVGALYRQEQGEIKRGVTPSKNFNAQRTYRRNVAQDRYDN